MKPAENPARERLLKRVARVLACPYCQKAVAAEETPGLVRCAACGKSYAAGSGQYVFWDFAKDEVRQDWLNRVKESAKRRVGRYYPVIYGLLAPVYTSERVKPFLASFDIENELVADLGCGTTVQGDNVVCVDGVDYPNVQVVGNLERLPFQNDSLAGLLHLAVLEHARDPAAQVAEMRRVLVPGGRALCFVPFIQGFHASPYDYQRYTKSGLCEIFREFDILDIRVGAGPTSSLLWILQEWLALVLSLGSVRLYRVILPLTWILSPLKYLDLILMRHPAATVIASGHFIEIQKPLAAAGREAGGDGPAMAT